MTCKRRNPLKLKKMIFLAALLLLGLPIVVRAQQDQEFDEYKLRIDGFWFYSNPSGNFQGAADHGAVDLQGDLRFSSYSTFAGKIDWKFTRKNHFYLAGSPFSQSQQVVLNRQITFQNKTFLAGSTIRGSLDSNLYAPGYQYDIIRRKRGHLGIGVQVDLFDSSASISAAAQVVNGQPQPALSARGA
jgi:hypothetical protein